MNYDVYIAKKIFNFRLPSYVILLVCLYLIFNQVSIFFKFWPIILYVSEYINKFVPITNYFNDCLSLTFCLKPVLYCIRVYVHYTSPCYYSCALILPS